MFCFSVSACADRSGFSVATSSSPGRLALRKGKFVRHRESPTSPYRGRDHESEREVSAFAFTRHGGYLIPQCERRSPPRLPGAW